MKHLIHFRIFESQSSSGLTPEQERFLNICSRPKKGGNWSVNPSTGLVDIHTEFGSPHEYGLPGNYLGIKFGNALEDFNCSNNDLTSLEGFPSKVGGYFNCSKNQLKSLKGAPQTVDKGFYCFHNKLQSLEGAPQTVGGDFYCYLNQLTSLEGAPQTVDWSFFCQKNELTSLKGSPRKVGRSFDCSKNKLTSLEGAPQTVNGDFICSGNQLTSLKGAPQTVDGDFICSGNQLTSLEGAPQTVGGNFFCEGNKLTSLEGAPQTVGGGFLCGKFELISREDEDADEDADELKSHWNMEGWTKVLNTGTEEAKKLILTLPVFRPEIWNSKLKQEPKATILQMVNVWDNLPKEIQDQIQIPSNMKDGFESLLDLERAGIF